jgi:U6 snRNA-associated Sm-like protein LSm8
MKGSDKHTNVILDKCYERVFSPTGTEIVELGLYIIKGDNMYGFVNLFIFN